MNNAELLLPSQFLIDANILGNKENDKNGVNADLGASFGFLSEFLYQFYLYGVSSTALSSLLESVAGSTKTDSTDSDVDEDFFAALTRLQSQSSLQETPKLTVPTCHNGDKTEAKVLGTFSEISNFVLHSPVSDPRSDAPRLIQKP